MRNANSSTSEHAQLPTNSHPPSPARNTLAWLDALKGVAILAVVLDHAFLVDNYVLWKHLYFSVSWFIFLAGVSNTTSALGRGFQARRDTFGLWRRRVATILPPYLAASLLALVFIYIGRQPLSVFAHEFFLFHTLPPLYFIALLFQLLLVFPLLFVLLFRAGWAGKLLVAASIVPVAAILSHRITFPWVLGAHYLFGASFLYLFVLGMLLAPRLVQERPHHLVWIAAGILLFAVGEWQNLSTGGELMTHPPSNVLVIYSTGLLAIAYGLSRRYAGSGVVLALGWLGRRSLDVFVYHYLFLTPFLALRHTRWMPELPIVWDQLIPMVIAVPLAIAGSLVTGAMVARALRSLRGALKRRPGSGVAAGQDRPAGRPDQVRARVLVPAGRVWERERGGDEAGSLRM